MLWRSLLDIKCKNGNEDWCVVGHFNKILRRGEKIEEGSYFSTRGMKTFRDFIENMGLVDIPCVGGKFT